MKSAVETVSPTRVRLTVEVPFEELKPSLDAAYKKIASQVRVPGFRPGRVPAPIIDQRIGRGFVLEQALEEAVPRFYGEAVRDNSVQVLGHPDLEVTDFGDRADLKFTAEVEVRPEIELPDYEGLPVTVDDADVSDEEVDQQLSTLRERFAVLRTVERPARDGDYVTIDLTARAPDGTEVPDASATGLSHQVGSGALLEGLDEAVAGLGEGASATFSTTLSGADAPGPAQVTVTVTSVKEKELPGVDDDFASTASEFDTVEELRADIRSRLERAKRYQQGAQARDRVLEALLDRVDVPVPEKLLEAELEQRRASLGRQLSAAGMTREALLSAEGKNEEEFERDFVEGTQSAIRSQFVLDAIVGKEEFGIDEAELTQHIVSRSARLGVAPQQYAEEIMRTGQLPALAGEVLRAKALAFLLEHAAVTDASGRPVDLSALDESAASSAPTRDVEDTEDTEGAEDGEGAEAGENEADTRRARLVESEAGESPGA